MFTHKHPFTRRLHLIYALIVIGILCIAIVILQTMNWGKPFSSDGNEHQPGKTLDSINGIAVYYNGATDNFTGRNVTSDGYNLGLKWQCVEFVKRYYYFHLSHKMPDATGNAKDFFDQSLPDAAYNEQRALVQYRNASLKKPEVDDIIIFDGHLGNKYGHIAIISAISNDSIQIIQQNAGPYEPTRETLALNFNDGRWRVMHKHVLGWLRIE